MIKVALLGVTGYIGQSLLSEFFKEYKEYQLFLFSRSKRTLQSVTKRYSKVGEYSLHTFDDFSQYEYDVVINCTGIGDPVSVKKNPSEIFHVTEEIDAMIIAYLTKKPKTQYINMSTGAVYGDNFKKPLVHETPSVLHISELSTYEYYAIAKINSEAKHRSLSHLNIVDLRVFAFFSSFVDTDASFLMSEIVRCIVDKKVFETHEDNIVRDYITPFDLFSLIKLLMKEKNMNTFFDVYSKKPISKFELLDSLKENYGLVVKVTKNSQQQNSSVKKVYYSKNKKAESLGYIPKYSSLIGIEEEMKKLFILK